MITLFTDDITYYFLSAMVFSVQRSLSFSVNAVYFLLTPLTDNKCKWNVIVDLHIVNCEVKNISLQWSDL